MKIYSEVSQRHFDDIASQDFIPAQAVDYLYSRAAVRTFHEILNR